MTNPSPTHEDWEKEFDELWSKESGLPTDGGIKFTEPYKILIRSLLAAEERKVSQRISSLKLKKRKGDSTGQKRRRQINNSAINKALTLLSESYLEGKHRQ